MLGLCASVQSLLRTVGPTLGGFLYVNYGVSSIGTVQFVVNVAVFLYLLWRHLNKKPENKEWNWFMKDFFCPQRNTEVETEVSETVLRFFPPPRCSYIYSSCLQKRSSHSMLAQLLNIFRVQPLDGSTSSVLLEDTWLRLTWFLASFALVWWLF